MKKLQRKLSLARETLCRLDAANLSAAAGGQIGGGGATRNQTDCSRCFVCENLVAPAPGTDPAAPVFPADPGVVVAGPIEG